MTEPAPRPLWLGVIILTPLIDLTGSSVIIPLGSDRVECCLKMDGRPGVLGRLLSEIETVALALSPRLPKPVR